MSQILVTYHGEEERTTAAKFLKSRGYKDVQGLAKKEPTVWHVPCICVDLKENSFFTINATCAAGFSMSKKTFYKVNDLESVFPEGQLPKSDGKRGPRAIYIDEESRGA